MEILMHEVNFNDSTALSVPKKTKQRIILQETSMKQLCTWMNQLICLAEICLI